MTQYPLPLFPEKPTNVASVPQRSPFRYPGGKTWLIPQIRIWLSSLKAQPQLLIEPFAGGGIVGLTAAFENLVDQVMLVEIDEQVAAVWQTIFNTEYGSWLADAIMHFPMTSESVNQLLEHSDLSIQEKALQTIVKNRINRGGILAKGAGRVKSGENNRGIQSRWYPTTLRKRILDIVTIKDKFIFLQSDGLEVISEHKNRKDVVYFVDPPYTAAGKKPGSRLYDHFELDHDALFEKLNSVHGDFLITYDDSVYIRDLAKKFGLAVKTISMKNTHHTQQTELLIGRDLRWLSYM